MIRKSIVNYVYNKFFTTWLQKELGGENLASNVVTAMTKTESPITIGAVCDDGNKVVMSESGATAICNHLGIDLFIREVQINLAYINTNKEVDEILSSKPVLMATEKDLKLLLAVALHFKDKTLLRQAVEDPTNGGVMRSSETFKYLERCYELFE